MSQCLGFVLDLVETLDAIGLLVIIFSLLRLEHDDISSIVVMIFVKSTFLSPSAKEINFRLDTELLMFWDIDEFVHRSSRRQSGALSGLYKT